jgi:hypothetical protein
VKGTGNMFLRPLASPQLNACQGFGMFAARLHASKCVGALDLTNCMFEPDGPLEVNVFFGRGRILARALTTEERANDLATLKKQLSAPEWKAIKLGYRFGSPDDAEEVLAQVETPA